MSVSARDALALLIGVLLWVGNGLATDENRHAFKTLCSLIRLTDTAVKIPEAAPHPDDIRGDLIKLNMTTAEDDWYDLFSGKDEDTWDKVKATDKFKALEKISEWSDTYAKWNEAKKELLEDAKDKKEFERPPASRQRKIAHSRIRRLWARFLDTRDKRTVLADAVRGIAGEVEKKFKDARTGKDDRPNATDDSFDHNTRSGNACGNGGTTATGKSLANDIVCICTHTSSQGNNVCVSGYDGQSKTWSGAPPTTEFETLHRLCPEESKNFKVTAAAVRGRLAKFWAQLGKNQASAAKANDYVLGGGTTGVSSGSCAGGGGNDAQMCINYKANLVGSGASGIPWVNKLEAAAELLEKLDADEKKIHAFDARAESLRDAAWAAYAEAKLPDPAGTVDAPGTAAKTDKPAALAPGPDGKTEERSTTTIPRFILPWTLLV